MVKNLPANAGDTRDAGQSLGWEDPLEKGMAAHSSILAWRIPWTEEPGGLQSIRSQRVRHNKQLSTHLLIHLITFFCFLGVFFCQETSVFQDQC